MRLFKPRPNDLTPRGRNIYQIWDDHKNQSLVNLNHQDGTSLYSFNTFPIIKQALQKIHNINYWHTGWRSNYFDFDRDMYNACANQSQKLVDLFCKTKALENQTNHYQFRDAYQNYVSCRDDLKMLATLAKKENPLYYPAIIALTAVIAFHLGLFFCLWWFSLFALLLAPMPALSLTSFAIVTAYTLLCGIWAAVSFAIIQMNYDNPSLQGSSKLATSIEKLIEACDAQLPETIQNLNMTTYPK